MIQRVTLPQISVDPEGRCASLLLTVDSVAIIPFQVNDLSADDSLLHNDVIASRCGNSSESDCSFVKSLTSFSKFCAFQLIFSQQDSSSCYQLHN